ncbi:hypothetical protein Q4E93_18440 [Flavitalea sp. BT771]|uniref:hypothetical protein n=1 Tax=Flavitalea sp. BT771 TaxID=3063329 RepID=UPI0026E3E032|nr:hypothetical protein [Flavitalea sp. BT771]MDO6432591.1 hypothetical protein [Flavitalea sp. BT771]MDV6222133.1 hypothetical protein [Flavitalea sp. BT771]
MRTHVIPDTIPEDQDDPRHWDAVNRRLKDILLYLESLSEKKDAEILALREQLQQCRQAGEGTHQLINKLLNDIDNYRKDIEWYQRTYEQRSLPGTIWQKLFRRKRN